MSEKLDTSLENVFPDDPGTSRAPRPGPDGAVEIGRRGRRRPAAVRRLRPRRHGRRAVTLRDHVGEQIAFAFADPAARLIARELADRLDEAGYLRADLGDIAERLGVDAGEVARGARPSARPSSRPASSRATSPNAWRCSSPARPARSGHARAARQSRPAGAARFPGAEAALRRRRGGSARHAGRDPRARSAARHGLLRRRTPTRSSPMSRCGPASDGSWAVELNPETLPRVLVDQIYFAQVVGPTRRTRPRRTFSPSACRTPTG